MLLLSLDMLYIDNYFNEVKVPTKTCSGLSPNTCLFNKVGRKVRTQGKVIQIILCRHLCCQANYGTVRRNYCMNTEHDNKQSSKQKPSIYLTLHYLHYKTEAQCNLHWNTEEAQLLIFLTRKHLAYSNG